MVYRSEWGQPLRGSTEWGAREFYRLLEEEERLAAGRQQPGVAPPSVPSDPDRLGVGRYAAPKSGQSLLSYANGRPLPISPSVNPRSEFRGALVPQLEYHEPPAAANSAASLNRIMRGYSGEQWEGRLPPGYVPRYHGLGEEMAHRQWSRAALQDWLQQQKLWDREEALSLLEGEDGDDFSLTDVWEGIAGLFGDDTEADPPPAAAAALLDEEAQVRRIVEAFSDAGIFLSERPETRQDNRDIVAMVRREVRACGAKSEHTHGAGKPENIHRKIRGELKGSRRPDGTIEIIRPDGSKYLYEFNTVDTHADGTMTGRESRAAADILALHQALEPEFKVRFDVYGKRIMTKETREEWRKRIGPMVGKSVRSFLGC